MHSVQRFTYAGVVLMEDIQDMLIDFDSLTGWVLYLHSLDLR